MRTRASSAWSDVGSPGSHATSFHTCQVLRPRRAVWDSVAGDPRVAAGPAVGLDDEPASRPARRSGSQTGLGRADHDAAALLAAHDLVLRGVADAGEVDVAELEPAAAAAAVAQLGGGHATAAGADLLVEGDELVADTGDDVGPSGADLLRLGVERREGGVALGLEGLDACDELDPAAPRAR